MSSETANEHEHTLEESAAPMITSFKIEGYRGFELFEMTSLGRINLLVGENNSGKTSILEALHLLVSGGKPSVLWDLVFRRGEHMPDEQDRRFFPLSMKRRPEVDISHLFRGHGLRVGTAFKLSAKNATPERLMSFEIMELSPKERADLAGIDPREEGIGFSRFALRIREGATGARPTTLPLGHGGGLLFDYIVPSPSKISGIINDEQRQATQFVTTESMESDELIDLWGNIALTQSEEMVRDALKLLDSSIDRIAAKPPSRFFGNATRGGFIVKQQGSDAPIPIGSMGDGMWRMLALTIAITQCKGGVLLVDEIDTGLHHTVMGSMWKLLFKTAKELDVQVFATTHSHDCVHSLASICVNDDEASEHVTLQRIETGRTQPVSYSEGELRVISQRNIETR